MARANIQLQESNSENDFEVELTINHGRTDPYTHGDGYGHIALAVDDVDAEHERFSAAGLSPTDVKEFHRDGALMAKFFFVQDPDDHGGRFIAGQSCQITACFGMSCPS